MATEEERRADTVAVSRKAFNFAVTVAAGATLAVGAALFRIATDHAALLVRVDALEQFGQKTGRRWTFEDAQEANGRLSEELRSLREWKDRHTEWGREMTGGWTAQHIRHKEEIAELKQRVHQLEVGD